MAAKTSDEFPTGTKYSYVHSDNSRDANHTPHVTGALNGSTQNHNQLYR